MKDFWLDTLWRCVYTFCESVVGVLTVANLTNGFDWRHQIAVIAVTTIATFLKQLGVYAYSHFKHEGDDEP